MRPLGFSDEEMDLLTSPTDRDFDKLMQEGHVTSGADVETAMSKIKKSKEPPPPDDEDEELASRKP